MRIGIDLLWVRPGKNGGTESYIRNILDGFILIRSTDDIILFVSRDNADSFNKYSDFETVVCPVDTGSFIKRVVWENIHLHGYTKTQNIDVWFFPVYSRPYTMGNIPSVTVIHDLQAIHYPEYFSKVRNIYFRYAWKQDCKKSTNVVTISEFCKRDIVDNLGVDSSKVKVIYNPISIDESASDFSLLSNRFGLESGRYYYTVSSLAKHKNLITILKMMKMLKEIGKEEKLVISGVKVNAEGEIFEYIKKNDLSDRIIYTGFISNEDRNALYDNCKIFLFPSVFEGFGMPPIEAMMRGKPVLTTKEASLYEVTEGAAYYVENPFNEKEWFEKVIETESRDRQINTMIHNNKYSLDIVVKEYLEVLKDAASTV